MNFNDELNSIIQSVEDLIVELEDSDQSDEIVSAIDALDSVKADLEEARKLFN